MDDEKLLKVIEKVIGGHGTSEGQRNINPVTCCFQCSLDILLCTTVKNLCCTVQELNICFVLFRFAQSCVFGARKAGRGFFSFNRKSDHLRCAVFAMVERCLNPSLQRCAPLHSTSFHRLNLLGVMTEQAKRAMQSKLEFSRLINTRFVLFCTVLYCSVLYCSVLYCSVLYCSVLYRAIMHCIVLYCIVLYCIVLFCTVLYCSILYCIVLYYSVLYCTVP